MWMSFPFEWSMTKMMTGTNDSDCHLNCSGRGECMNGTCYCQIQFDGSECSFINFSYHLAFASIFFLLALTSLIQLIMCVHAEYLRMKKNPSVLRACRITTQKFIYFLVFLASMVRGAYFASPTIGMEWSTSLLSAYYPVVLTGSSLIVCFWAEVFHLREIQWDRPRFLSKSYLGFITFNVISYSLLFVELILIWIEDEKRLELYGHIFNGCYAVLMFIVVVFFLVYGVEVFFKVRGGFTIPRVSLSINPSRLSSYSSKLIQKENNNNELLLLSRNLQNASTSNDIPKVVNTSQLHQSRVGLLSQAVMMLAMVIFLFAETMEDFWKTKVNLFRRNTHDVLFRVFEVGVAVWFPCVLWNCIRPEQLWCLNPKKILERLPPRLRDVHKLGDAVRRTPEHSDDEDEKGDVCWICYDEDRTDAGPMIHPCNCRGDVGTVHHDCLRRWLIESADNPESLKCKVCATEYMVEKGSQFSLSQGFTPFQIFQTLSLISVILGSIGGAWILCQIYSQPWTKLLAVPSVLLIQYICLRFLGLNTVSAYQRAKVSALKIVNIKRQSISST